MNKEIFNQNLLRFLDGSPTPFHALANLCTTLRSAGYEALLETDKWNISPPGKYFVTRGQSSLVAFSLGSKSVTETGIHMAGSHTDSPCLKLKPNAAFKAHGYWQLGVEVYGGVLLNPWFDRDLSLAGRVSLCLPSGELVNRLINFDHAIAIIPSLAIHLDREANANREINAQTYLPAIVATDSQDFDLDAEIMNRLVTEEPGLTHAKVSAHELSLYPVEKAAFVGLRQEFIASARLDNLLSCYTGVQALIDTAGEANRLVVCNDHEEVGSGSSVGASGTLLRSVIERLTESNEGFSRAIAHSTLVSTDNAHGVHPNFSDRHDKQHLPKLNAGPAIKVNANQAYASNSTTVSLFKQACVAADVPAQSFVSRADVRCGSTIGPLTATALGVQTVDVGVPTFAMHSIRELAGSDDPHWLYLALNKFFERNQKG
ncbi:MAG: aspartyl aminopeptidase [Gammaproteobacteria bacterium]|jgi:aspartyl aminopeptidase